MSERKWRIEPFGTSFAIFDGERRVAYFYGATENWTEDEARTNAERALAKNDEPPTVCPAGPGDRAMVGALRERIAIALWELRSPAAIRDWDTAAPWIKDYHYAQADAVIATLHQVVETE